jgi:hypothetical protein
MLRFFAEALILQAQLLDLFEKGCEVFHGNDFAELRCQLDTILQCLNLIWTQFYLG